MGNYWPLQTLSAHTTISTKVTFQKKIQTLCSCSIQLLIFKMLFTRNWFNYGRVSHFTSQICCGILSQNFHGIYYHIYAMRSNVFILYWDLIIPAVLWIVNVCKRKPRQKKYSLRKIVYFFLCYIFDIRDNIRESRDQPTHINKTSLQLVSKEHCELLGGFQGLSPWKPILMRHLKQLKYQTIDWNK